MLPDFAMGVDLNRIALMVGARVNQNRGVPRADLLLLVRLKP